MSVNNTVNTPEINESQVEIPTPDTPLARNRYAESMQTRRRMPRPVKFIFVGLVIVGLGFGAWKAYDATRVDTTVDANATAFAQMGYLETYVEGSGVTQAKLREELGEDLVGTVTDVLVQTGDVVTAGDVLVVVNPEETHKELTAAQEGLRDAQDALAEAGEQLAGLHVTAPFSGRLLPSENGEVRFQQGDYLGGGTSIGRLVDDSTMSLELYFSYAYANQITQVSAATVSIPAAMGLFNATVSKVEYIEKITPEGAKLFRVVLQLPNSGTLSEDMIATATVNLSTGGVATPSDAGVLSFAREMEILLEASGELSATSNPYYYKFNSGATIVSLSNPDLVRAYDNQKASVETAQELVAEVEQRIADCTLTSPIDGMVLRCEVMVGESLKASAPVVIVADLSSLVVNISVPEMDIDKVKVGQSATITVFTDTDAIYAMGMVDSVGLTAETGGSGNSLTFPAVVAVDNFDGALSPDRYVDYQIQTAVAFDCVTVPVAALVNTDSGTAVFAKPAEGQTFAETLPIPEGTEVPAEYFLIPVVSGISDSANVEIISGLDEGTEVYLAGPTDAYASMDFGMMAG